MPGVSNSLGVVDVLGFAAAVTVLCGFLVAVAHELAREDRRISWSARSDNVERVGVTDLRGPDATPGRPPERNGSCPVHRDYRGHTCLFCSGYCAQSYLKDPTAYAAGAAALGGPV